MPPIARFSPNATSRRTTGSKAPKFKSEKKSADGRQRDGQHDEGHASTEPVRAGQIEDDTDPGRHENQQAHDLDENVDQDAGNGQVCGDSELGQQPRADDVAADHRERKQRIDRLANEPQADENAGAAHVAA